MSLPVTYVALFISVIFFILVLKTRKCQQLLALVVALIGFLGTVLTCALPIWKVTAYVSGNIVTAQVLWEGLWVNCLLHSTGHRQCKAYDSLLAVPEDLQAARAPMCISIAVGVAAIFLSMLGARCTNSYRNENITKALMVPLVGIVFMAAGVLCIATVSWSAHVTITGFYNPLATEGRRGELGAAICVGWVSGFLFLGGGMLRRTYRCC